MEITAHYTATGQQRAIDVSERETVLSLKIKAIDSFGMGVEGGETLVKPKELAHYVTLSLDPIVDLGWADSDLVASTGVADNDTVYVSSGGMNKWKSDFSCPDAFDSVGLTPCKRYVLGGSRFDTLGVSLIDLHKGTTKPLLHCKVLCVDIAETELIVVTRNALKATSYSWPMFSKTHEFFCTSHVKHARISRSNYMVATFDTIDVYDADGVLSVTVPIEGTKFLHVSPCWRWVLCCTGLSSMISLVSLNGGLVRTYVNPEQRAIRCEGFPFASDSKLVAFMGGDFSVQVWEVNEDESDPSEASRGVVARMDSQHSAPITWTAFSDCSKWLFTASTDGRVFQWDVPSGAKVAMYGVKWGSAMCWCSANQDSTKLVFGTRNGLVTCDLATNEEEI